MPREYFIVAVTRGWIVCPSLKLWPSFPWMCYSGDLWVAHHHVKNQGRTCFSIWFTQASNTEMTSVQLNRYMTNSNTHKHTDPSCRVFVGRGEGAGNPLWLWQKGSALRPGRPKIVPTSKRDLGVSPMKETSGLDYVFCSIARNLCGLRGLEWFRDFFGKSQM